ncbi:uncharacterized protein LOC110466226 [Mizuhopecten yessoensis]|uniref:uncharacterized protein LOC110466226 n=1 Tax=Mizuhopecten yessoensis TaxID=6573 RepID=UPI000B4578BC|nr:uncharacterized protein LOC110466226 [Mizuhopecten yessoensis]
MATSKYKAQIPFRTKGQTTCTHHRRRQLDHYCEECQVPVCIKCVSTVHKSHPLCDLSEITPQTKQDIQSFIDKTEKVDLVQIDQYITSTDEQLKDNASIFDKLSKQVKIQTNKLIEDLDLLAAQTLSLYKQMEEDNTKLLQTYKQDLEMYNTQLKQQVKECKITLQRGSDIHIYDTGHDIQSTVTLPVEPTTGTASFTPNQNPQGSLEQAMGEVNTLGQGQSQALKGQDRLVGSSAEQRPYPTQQRSESKGRKHSTKQRSKRRSKGTQQVSSPLYALFYEAVILEEWESQCYITSVCPTTDGQVWTSFRNSDILTLLDRNGTVVQVVQHNTRITDISLSPTANALWVCDKGNNITELVAGRLVQRFSTKEEPECLCITASNHVIVGMSEHISKFTTKGKLVRTSLTAGTGKPLVCTPYRISECPVTHNVTVADWDNRHDGGEGKPHVVIMDIDFKKLYVYGGEVQHTHQSASQSEGGPLNPFGVVYDSVGNLVIADNNSILITSYRGELLRIIHTHDSFCTQAVGVDKEDVLWAASEDEGVKLLQYISV